MALVAGYRLFFDGGAAGPTSGDSVSGSVQTLVFEKSDFSPVGSSVVNYPSMLGNSSGTFYFVSGSYYFVPNDPLGFPTNEAGTVSSFTASVRGTTGNDAAITGTSGGELIFDTNQSVYTPTGNDSINAGCGSDTIMFGDGNDTIRGGNGNDTIHGGTGSDHISGASGTDYLYGDDDADEIWVTDDHGLDYVWGGEGGFDFDTLGFANYVYNQGVTVTFTGDEAGTFDFIGTTGSGIFAEIEKIVTTTYSDYVDASSSSFAQNFFLDGGNDTLVSGSGPVSAYGGTGDDVMIGGSSVDIIVGGEGNDSLSGGEGDDTLDGSDGADSLLGGGGNDELLGEGLWLNPLDYTSSSGLVAVNLTVTNAADGPIELWWVNNFGVLEYYSTIAAGEIYVQPTFAEHNWILRDPDGFYLRVIEGGDQTVTYGATTDDLLEGGAGDDWLYGMYGMTSSMVARATTRSKAAMAMIPFGSPTLPARMRLISTWATRTATASPMTNWMSRTCMIARGTLSISGM